MATGDMRNGAGVRVISFVAGLAFLILLYVVSFSGCQAQSNAVESPDSVADGRAPVGEFPPPTADKGKNSDAAPARPGFMPAPTERARPSPRAAPQASPTTLTVVVQDQQVLGELKKEPADDAGGRAVRCDERLAEGTLLTTVTQEYSLGKEFAPEDLVPLADYLPFDVTLGYPTEIRRIVAEPLTRMINDMRAAGLRPKVLSGYRSYAAQAIAWRKWNTLYPEHAAIISALPGHSEHQLGTVVDFGSPELPGLVGQRDIQFHTYFARTSEGQWLAEHAHEYGFTLSYPLEALETTGFYYEPWHYRYVGQEMAERLRQEGLTLTEYQLASDRPPCEP